MITFFSQNRVNLKSAKNKMGDTIKDLYLLSSIKKIMICLDIIMEEWERMSGEGFHKNSKLHYNGGSHYS